MTPEQRALLQAFVARSPTGMAYLRRTRILLLADEGWSAESIASEVGVPIVRVRQLLRAYNQEGFGLFPEALLSPPSPFSPDDPIAEAGRKIMGALLEKVVSYRVDLETAVDVTSVHETRKGIRRLRTALRLFGPYFEKGVLNAYRKRFRKTMRRLNRSRDLAVFEIKLDRFVEEAVGAGSLTDEEQRAIEAMQEQLRVRRRDADDQVRRYLAKGKYQALLSDFERFTQEIGEGAATIEDPLAPVKTRHVAPILIIEKVAAVRAYDDCLVGAPLERLHALRIRFKELRYTLEFFEPAMGASAGEALTTVKKLLMHLGDLNDARVHLEMLSDAEEDEMEPGVTLYRDAKQVELEQLVSEFPLLWTDFDQLAWRQQLAAAIATL